jgi:outer membrane protein TolC
MTNEPLDMHRPTAEFRDYLEGEVIREYRRRRTVRRLRAAAVIIASVGIGMSATLASAQVRQNVQKDSLLEAAQADATLAQVRLDLARAAMAEESKAVKAGARGSSGETELAVRIAETELARIALNMEEIRASALPPRDDLNAPLVGGKDFVRQRLELQTNVANLRLKAAEAAQWLVARRVAVGADPDLELTVADGALRKAQADLSVEVKRLEARKSFVEKGTPIDSLTRIIDRADAQRAMIFAMQDQRLARERFTLLEKQQKVGAATELDVLRANVALKEAELAVDKAVKRFRRPE